MRELTFIFPIFLGLLFLMGKGFVIGVEGSEPVLLPFPENPFAGWALIWLGILWALPPWTVVRISRFIKRLIKGSDTTKKLIRQAEEESKEQKWQ